jgi:hypothetical protein
MGPRESAWTDDGLKQLVGSLVQGTASSVSSAYLVRNTGDLPELMQSVEEAKLKVFEVKHRWEQDGYPESGRADVSEGEAELAAATLRFDDARGCVLKAIDKEGAGGPRSEDGSMFSSVGFVTFNEQTDAMLALETIGDTQHQVDLKISQPADPTDIIFAALQGEAEKNILRNSIIGYGLLSLLFFQFVPLVMFIIPIAKVSTMERHLPHFVWLLRKIPGAVQMWDGLTESFLLNILMSFVPTLMMLIFTRFFTLASNSHRQLKLQRWYFWFLTIFVLLVHAVGTTLWTTWVTLVREPWQLFGLLGDNLPRASQFYLNFIASQWAVQSLEAVRIANLAKFLWYRRKYPEAVARDLAEPEDQDYDGIGARSSRVTLSLVVTIVFSTLCPMVCVVGVLNFAMARAIYGYLIVFAETKKPDLGGHFWDTQLQHVLQGLVIYVALMIGVSTHHPWPCAMLNAAMVFVIVTIYQFRQQFRWQIPTPEQLRTSVGDVRFVGVSYVQPELQAKSEG